MHKAKSPIVREISPFGFYVQLAWMGDQISEHDSAVVTSIGKHAMDGNHSVAIASAGASVGAAMPALAASFSNALASQNVSNFAYTLGQTGMNAGISAGYGEVANALGKSPIGAILNQFNPALMLANSSYNIQYGSQVLGKDSGYLLEANLINSIKQPMSVGGSLLVAYGASPAGDPITKAIALAIGSTMVFTANSIQVNPTTGERLMKATDQSVITSAVQIVTSVIGGAGALGTAGSVVMAGTSSLATSGMNYNADGVSQGWSLDSKHSALHGEQALLNAAVSAGTAFATAGLNPKDNNAFSFGLVKPGSLTNAQSALLGDVVSTSVNVAGQYAAQQMWGAEHSGYDSLRAGPDLSRLFGMAVSLGAAAEKDAEIAKAKADYALAMDFAKKSNDQNSKQAAVAILAGLGYSREESEKILSASAAKSFLESKAEGDAAMRLHSAIANKGGYGAYTGTASMAFAADGYQALESEVQNYEKMTGRPLTNEEFILIAGQYGISPEELFSSATNVTMAKSTGDWSGRFQEQVSLEGAAFKEQEIARANQVVSRKEVTPEKSYITKQIETKFGGGRVEVERELSPWRFFNKDFWADEWTDTAKAFDQRYNVDGLKNFGMALISPKYEKEGRAYMNSPAAQQLLDDAMWIPGPPGIVAGVAKHGNEAHDAFGKGDYGTVAKDTALIGMNFLPMHKLLGFLQPLGNKLGAAVVAMGLGKVADKVEQVIVNRLNGAAFENFVRQTENLGAKEYFQIFRNIKNFHLPDFVERGAAKAVTAIGDAKHVLDARATRQIQTFLDYATEHKIPFNLYVREGYTVVRDSLRKAVELTGGKVYPIKYP